MSGNIKCSFVALRKLDGTLAHKRIYAVSENILSRYQLIYYHRQGYIDQDKKVLDLLNQGDGPLDLSFEEYKIFKKNKFRYELEHIFTDKFVFHSKEIQIEEDPFDTAMIKDSKETQRILEEFTQKNPKGSYVHYITGLYQEKGINSDVNITEAIRSYQTGFQNNFCHFCTVKLLRMNLETMELNQSTLLQNFEKALEICGYILSNAGVFYYIDKEQHYSPLLYYICVMMDIYAEFREFIYAR